MRAAGREVEHFQFIQLTDRKNLKSQIKKLVNKAKDVFNDELKERTERLRKQLENEDAIYQKEFSDNVRSHIDRDIRERRDALRNQMEEKTKEHQQILEKRQIQHMMTNCYEVRQLLRAEDLKNVKICQAEQIIENRRKKQRETEAEKHWRDLENKHFEKLIQSEEKEKCLRKCMQHKLDHILRMQVEEKNEQRELELRQCQQDAEDSKKKQLELQRNEYETELQQKTEAAQKKLQYRTDLLQQIAANKAARDAEAQQLKADHLASCREAQRLEAEQSEMLAQQKINFRRATQQYLQFVRQMRELERSKEKMTSERIDDLYRVDICTKTNLGEQMRLRAAEAARCHAILKQQICEAAERRLCQEAEHRKNKMLENRFVHEEIPRSVILAKHRKIREDLDQQIIEMKRVREEEEKKFEQKLLKAVHDPVICEELAEIYIRDGIDFLKPHPNWKIYACPTIKCVPKIEEIDTKSSLCCMTTSEERKRNAAAVTAAMEKLRQDNHLENQKDGVNLDDPAAVFDISDEPNDESVAVKPKDRIRSCDCPPGTRRHTQLENAIGFF